MGQHVGSCMDGRDVESYPNHNYFITYNCKFVTENNIIIIIIVVEKNLLPK
jgi:hypothetical protein